MSKLASLFASKKANLERTTFESEADWRRALDRESAAKQLSTSNVAQVEDPRSDSDSSLSPPLSNYSSQGRSRHSSSSSLSNAEEGFFNEDGILELGQPSIAQKKFTAGNVVKQSSATQASDASIMTKDSSTSGSSSVLTAVNAEHPAQLRAVDDRFVHNKDAFRPTGSSAGPWKGASIRDISWGDIDERNVARFCAAFDRPAFGVSSEAENVRRPACSKPDSHERRRRSSSPQAGRRPRSSQRQQISSSDSPARPNASEEHDRLMESWTARLILNASLLDHELQAMEEEAKRRLQVEQLKAAEEERRARELEKQRQLDLKIAEAKNLAAAIVIQKELDEINLQECRIAQRARLRECAVCGDEKDKIDFHQQAPSAKCQHDAQVCKECLDNWILSAFNDHGIDGIKCPECPEKLLYEDVRERAKAETFALYDKATITQALSHLPEFAWCLSPTCKSGQLNVDNSNYMECVSCKYKQCLDHKVAWHTGETCKQYEFRTSGAKAREEEAKTVAMLDTMSKICPGPNCGWRIQKNSGCDHVTCRQCRFEFCWQCLASHAEIRKVGNTAHAKDCKFHSNNLEIAWPFNVHR